MATSSESVKGPGSRLCFAQRFNVIQHLDVNAMNDRVRPQTPVLRGQQSVSIPCRAFQESAIVGEPREPKLSFFGNQVTVEVARRHLSVRTPLLHWGRVPGHGKSQQRGFFPHFDRLYKVARRELAVSDRGRP